jgi:hypothetical protein
MARPALSSTTKVEEFQAIDIAWLRREGVVGNVGHSGCITWSRHGQDRGSFGYEVTWNGLRLRYHHTPYGGTAQEIDEVISVITTPMHFGGSRHWFRCPSCQHRCRVIYGGAHFRCRICWGAKYESQYERAPFRLSRRRWRIRGFLEVGWRPSTRTSAAAGRLGSGTG